MKVMMFLEEFGLIGHITQHENERENKRKEKLKDKLGRKMFYDGRMMSGGLFLFCFGCGCVCAVFCTDHCNGQCLSFFGLCVSPPFSPHRC